MSTKLACFLLLVLLILAGETFGQAKRSEAPDITDQLVTMAQDILSGQNVEKCISLVAPGARLVFGSVNADLKDVVLGRIKNLTLVEGPSHHPTALRFKTNESKDSAYLLLTTSSNEKELRYHTIVYMRDKEGKWRIETWHASDSEPPPNNR